MAQRTLSSPREPEQAFQTCRDPRQAEGYCQAAVAGRPASLVRWNLSSICPRTAESAPPLLQKPARRGRGIRRMDAPSVPPS